MRGIGNGQTVHLFVIPEVAKLISKELALLGPKPDAAAALTSASESDQQSPSPTKSKKRRRRKRKKKKQQGSGGTPARLATEAKLATPVVEESSSETTSFISDVAAWLTINSLRSEKLQVFPALTPFR